MKIVSVLIVLFLAGSSLINAQTPEWEWATNATGTDEYATVTGICTDANGNSYITGYFFNSSISFGNITLTNVQGYNLFIAKYDSSGNMLWAKTSGNEYAVGNAICVDDSGNCLLTGCVGYPPVILGNDTVAHPDTTGRAGIFIAKFDTSGNVLWVKNAVADNSGCASAISADKHGNSYLTLGDTTVKYNSSGNVVWISTSGGSYISTDAQGNSYITGNVDDEGIYLSKLDSSGNLTWATQTWNTGGNLAVTTFVTGISCDAHGNSYVVGGIDYYGADTLPYSNLLITKLDSTGNKLWTITMSSCFGSQGYSISTDDNGNSYVTGYFEPWGTAYMGNFNTGVSDSTYYQFLFAAKCNTDGSVIWLKNITAWQTNYTPASSISIDMNGNAYISGGYADTALNLASSVLAVNGPQSIYIAKLSAEVYNNIESLSPITSTITVYPNPTTGTVYFSGVPAGCILQIYNVLGQMISSSTINQSNYIINLSGKAKGMYLYRIIGADNAMQQGKVVVE